MRTFSRRSHPPLTRASDDGDVDIDDPALPAVPHLTGAGAHGVVGAAVEVAGGTLHELRASQVLYRPGSDLVVRYRADVTWGDGRRSPSETLLAAARRSGPLEGTVPVVADADGLVASVWRWPFDPVVIGLEDAVTSGRTDDLVADVVGARPSIDVVAYRPTERAVIRVTGDDGRAAYVKAVPPSALAALVERHERLHDAGLPVPEVLATDAARGLVVLRELPGTTLRERIKADLPGWPDAAGIGDLIARIQRTDPTGLGTRSGRVADGIGHAQLVATVLPEVEPVLARLTARLTDETETVRQRSGRVVHGDLHEGQLIVDGSGAVTGLLDVDDVAAGDPVDDFATFIAHLRFRARHLDPTTPAAGRLHRHVAALHAHAATIVGPDAIDVAVAACLVGLATGPFRMQRPGWEHESAGVVADAAELLGLPSDMSGFSAAPHEALTRGPQRGNRQPLPLTKGSA